MRENGAGLSRDARLVRSMFESAGVPVVSTIPQRRESRRACAANVFLEIVATTHFSLARTNIVVPNPEWWRSSWTQTIRRSDVVVFAKTRDTEEIFSRLGARVIRVGFTSDDRIRPVARKNRGFLHIAGKSCLKGTIPVLELWARRPDFPLLTVVDNLRRHTQFAGHRNIRVISERLDDEELATLQNNHLLHICPSEYEGFGHTLWEALSCASVCITTGAGPMEEILPPSGGFLVSPSRTGTKALATTQHVTADALEAVVDDALSRTDDELIAMGATARRWWERNDRVVCRAWLDAWSDVTSDSGNSNGRPGRPESRWTSPDVLKAAGASAGTGGIPRIVHHIFGLWDEQHDLPARFSQAAGTWWDHHPDWQHVLWRREDVERLVARIDENHARTYRSAIRGVQRADLARYLILLTYGGVYADLDVECRRSVGDLLDEHPYARAIVLVETVLTDKRANEIAQREPIRRGLPELRRRIANYAMIAAPGDRLLSSILSLSKERLVGTNYSDYGVIYSTGPDIVTEAVHKHPRGKELVVVSREMASRYVRHRADGTWRTGRDLVQAAIANGAGAA